VILNLLPVMDDLDKAEEFYHRLLDWNGETDLRCGHVWPLKSWRARAIAENGSG
jgi:hypothetical protein